MIRGGSPIASESNKRAKTQFLWRRFIDKRDAPTVLIMREQPNIEVMVKLMEEDRIPLVQRGYFDAWMDSIRKGEKTPKYYDVKYLQTEPEIRAPNGTNYGGSRYLGRLFARTANGGGCTRGQDVKREVRNTLYHDSHVDIDIVNAQPTIMSHVFGHLDIPTLKHYVACRDDVFASMEHVQIQGVDGNATWESIDKKTIKQLVNAILNGSKRKNLQPPCVRDIQFFKDLCMEAQEMFDELKSDYRVIRGILQRQSPNYHDGKLMALLYRDIEQCILVTMVEAVGEICQGQGERSNNLVLMHDGLLAPKVLSEIDCLSTIEDAVMEAHGIPIKLKIKPLEPFYSSCIEKAQAITDASISYEEWKMEFNKTHFRIRSPCAFVRVNPYGKRDYYSLAKFRDEVMAGRQECESL
jgi:hypothetical protein